MGIQQGLDADMMLNFQRVLANQAHMQQQQMAVMVQLFEAVSRMTTNVPQIPVQTVGVVSTTTLSNECLKHLLKVTNTFEKTLHKKQDRRIH